MYVKAFIVNVNESETLFYNNISIMYIQSRFKAFGVSVAVHDECSDRRLLVCSLVLLAHLSWYRCIRYKLACAYTIGTASTNSAKFRGIRPRMYIEDLL